MVLPGIARCRTLQKPSAARPKDSGCMSRRRTLPPRTARLAALITSTLSVPGRSPPALASAWAAAGGVTVRRRRLRSLAAVAAPVRPAIAPAAQLGLHRGLGGLDLVRMA